MKYRSPSLKGGRRANQRVVWVKKSRGKGLRTSSPASSPSPRTTRRSSSLGCASSPAFAPVAWLHRRSGTPSCRPSKPGTLRGQSPTDQNEASVRRVNIKVNLGPARGRRMTPTWTPRYLERRKFIRSVDAKPFKPGRDSLLVEGLAHRDSREGGQNLRGVTTESASRQVSNDTTALA